MLKKRKATISQIQNLQGRGDASACSSSKMHMTMDWMENKRHGPHGSIGGIECYLYAWPSGEVFRDYKYLSAEIYFVRGNILNLPRNMFLLRKHFYLSPKKYFVCGNIFNPPGFLFFAPRKHFHVLQKMLSIPGILFTSPKIICSCPFFLYHMHGFFVSIHFGWAVMPWLPKWSRVTGHIRHT